MTDKLPDQFGTCARCGKRFQPEWVEDLSRFNRCCEDCKLQNLLEGLGMSDIIKACGFKPDQHSPKELY